MASVELLGQSDGSLDANSAKRFVRTFFIDGIGRDAATTDPIVPPLKSPHPVYSDAVVDSYSVQEFPDGRSSVVKVYYSTDGTFRATPRIDPGDETNKPFSCAFSTTETSIPFAYERAINVPGNGSTRYVWAIDSKTIQETRVFYSVSFPLDYFDGAVAAVLGRQHNKLHLIEGKRYLFTVGNVTPFAKNRWTYEYSWMSDSGTREITGAPGTVLMPPADKPWMGDNYVREPYHQIIAIPNKESATNPPTFETFLSFEIDDTGFHSLPGYPFF